MCFTTKIAQWGRKSSPAEGKHATFVRTSTPYEVYVGITISHAYSHGLPKSATGVAGIQWLLSEIEAHPSLLSSQDYSEICILLSRQDVYCSRVRFKAA